jgi:hypothetical protein
MGCAPLPRKSENIPKTNAEPAKQEVTSIDNIQRADESRMTKVRFEDLANNDIAIKEERRFVITV